ncbi:MAG: benzoyl-CoA reductase subunit B [Haloarculaceae archaeon]|jgi:benzoyl-CoA reductase subunit B
MSTDTTHPGEADEDVAYHEDLEMYPEFNKFQYKMYRDFAEADGIKWGGSGWAYESLPEGLGDDVYFLAGEPYGAVVAYNEEISREFLNAADQHGIPNDMCGYMLNEWGGIIEDKYVLPDGTTYDYFPEVDFNFTSHICCTHSKWYQYNSELEAEFSGDDDEQPPFNAIDVMGGPNAYEDEQIVDYKVQQAHQAIDWMQEETGRDFDDERFINAVKNEMEGMSYWAKTMELQKNDPAPLEERRMFSLYVPSIARRTLDRSAQLYEDLYEEVKDKAERNATVTGPQKFRFISDSPPPWAHLDVYKYMRDNYGAVSLGSLYSWGLTGIWRGFDGGDEWDWEAMDTPMERGVDLDDRETAVREMIKWNLRRPSWNVFSTHLDARVEITRQMAEQFDVDFVLVHLNRGCEGWAQNQTEVSNALKEAGIPVLEYEGNQADTRDFDPSELRQKIDSFMEGRFGVEAQNE